MSTSDTSKLVKRPSSEESPSVDSTVTKKQKKPSPNSIKVPAEIYLQVLQSGRPGVGRCLFLFTSNERYLFNCPEGTARLAAEHGIKATKVQHVFCTQASWTNLGGLPGLFYTLRDAGHGQVYVHGPTNIEMIVETMKPYNDIPSIIDVVGLDYEEHPVYEDDGIKITSIPIFGSASMEMSSELESEDSDLSYDSALESQDSSNYESLGEFDENEAAAKIAQLFRSISGGSTKASRTSADTDSSCGDHQQTVEPEPRRDLAVAYLCEPKPKPGHISMEKCLEMGVPKGPLVGKLQRDESITLPDGRIIEPVDVKEAAILSPSFLIVECPSIDMISAFINHPLLKSLREGASDHRITLIVHLSPDAVANHDDYQKWLRGFSSLDGNKAAEQEQQQQHISHLFLNEACPFLPHSEAVFAQQQRLGLVHESIFPTLPSHVNAVQVRETDAAADISDTEACDVLQHCTSVHAVPLLKFHIRPPIGFDRSACLRLNRNDVLTLARSLPGFDDVNVAMKKQLESLYLAKAHHISRYPEVIFLGTSAATPAKTRNLSGIWLNLDDETSLLCDCGEGTLGQLVELFGPEEANRMLMKLKFVFISHLHADHHAGVCSIILARKEAFKAKGQKHPRLSLLASAPLFTMHNVFSSIVEPIGSLCRRIPTRSTTTPCVSIENGTSGRDLTKEGIAKVLAETGLGSVVLVKVNHPCIAYGIVMTTGGSAPKKIVYSGDTTPCEELIEAGRNADLLIHEATMENDLEEDALKKYHCTVRQAVDVAKAMGAKHTILTHFSCRYSRIPNISESDLDGSIGIAYDFMRIRFGELDIVPRLVPLLRAVFWDYFQDVLDKTGKRQQRKELEAQQEEKNQNVGLLTSLVNQLL